MILLLHFLEPSLCLQVPRWQLDRLHLRLRRCALNLPGLQRRTRPVGLRPALLLARRPLGLSRLAGHRLEDPRLLLLLVLQAAPL
jgi:hypothetical protein